MPLSNKMKKLMSHDPVTFTASTKIDTAVKRLLERKVSGGTVLDENNHVIGVVSEMDMLKAVEEMTYYNEGSGNVGDFMCTSVDVIDTDMDVYEIAKRMRTLKKRRLPVVEDGVFIGQISARSVLQALQDSKQ